MRSPVAGMSPEQRVQILRYHPGYRVLRRVLAVAVLGVLLALSWWIGSRSAQQARDDGDDERVALQSRLNEAVGERSDLEQRLANANADLEIDHAAAAQVRAELSDSQARIARLEQQVELYRSLLDSSAPQGGLSIHEIAVEPGARAGSHRFRIVVLQRARRYAELSGALLLNVRGQQAGRARTLSYADIGVPRGVDKLPMRLLYFQIIEGELELPPGFEPHEIVVTAEFGPRGRQRLSTRKPW